MAYSLSLQTVPPILEEGVAAVLVTVDLKALAAEVRWADAQP